MKQRIKPEISKRKIGVIQHFTKNTRTIAIPLERIGFDRIYWKIKQEERKRIDTESRKEYNFYFLLPGMAYSRYFCYWWRFKGYQDCLIAKTGLPYIGWNWEEIIYYDLLTCDQTPNSDLYFLMLTIDRKDQYWILEEVLFWPLKI